MNCSAARITVTGLVQGVGYRDFCRLSANELGLTGWVKNLHDGSVSLEVEGERASVDDFIVHLKRSPLNSRVAEVQARFEVFTGQYSTFEIV